MSFFIDIESKDKEIKLMNYTNRSLWDNYTKLQDDMENLKKEHNDKIEKIENDNVEYLELLNYNHTKYCNELLKKIDILNMRLEIEKDNFKKIKNLKKIITDVDNSTSHSIVNKMGKKVKKYINI